MLFLLVRENLLTTSTTRHHYYTQLLTTARPSGAHDLECFEIEGGGLLMAVANARDDNTQAVPTLVRMVGSW